MSHLTIRRRIVFVCDNAWFSEGMKHESTSWSDVIDFVSFSAITHDVIREMNFLRDVIVYASNGPVLINEINNLIWACHERSLSLGDIKLNFIFAGNRVSTSLINHLFFFPGSISAGMDIELSTTGYYELSMKKVINAINGGCQKVKGNVEPILTLKEIAVLNLSTAQRSVRTIAQCLQMSEKTIYAIRKNIAMKYNYTGFTCFYADFIMNSTLFIYMMEKQYCGR